jgi:hypothetical protein
MDEMSATCTDDVTALVLSVGEVYTERALASVRRQAPAVADTVVVQNVTPFHRALNTGAARVKTPFFVQVDADMVLDPLCCTDLRACVTERVGLVIGHLRDPMVGRVAGVKLFRTACVAAVQFPNSISPDTDFEKAMWQRGWTTVYAMRHAGLPPVSFHTFGEHCPDYTPLYTFRKYLLAGARLRYRRRGATPALIRQLRAGAHPAARFAIIGAAHGIFLDAHDDLLVPFESTAEFERLASFLEGPAGGATGPTTIHTFTRLDPPLAFAQGYQTGIDLHRHQALADFVTAMDQLACARGAAAYAALIGLCHGIFQDAYDETILPAAFARLRPLLLE